MKADRTLICQVLCIQVFCQLCLLKMLKEKIQRPSPKATEGPEHSAGWLVAVSPSPSHIHRRVNAEKVFP